ncbi:MAG: thioredoxin family protein [Fibrobacteraceae bacterium]|nr:thioredoxin family protein [Fibrobacteraceae bacterium]
MNNMPPPHISIGYDNGSIQKNTLTVTIVIPDNWHVNSNIPVDEFLKPSKIEVGARGIQFADPVWPEPLEEYVEILDLKNKVFKGMFQIKIPVSSVEDGYDSTTTNVTFHYQACDNSICLAPSQVSAKIDGSSSALKKNDNEQQQNQSSIAATTENQDSVNIFLLLFFAFVGGIILNLMPCVLPVLSLKLFSLIKQAGENRAKLLALGLGTSIGILVSFWVLAAIITIVRMGGGNAGWGMQFQSAGFIAFMVVILTAFAMSFFGLFEIWLPGSAVTKMDSASHKQGLPGAFFTGALLVLLSTPCSAPFLGSAMGFAFTASTPVLFLFFTAAALGLALPYILISALPGLLKLLPKPGSWMVVLQKIMGILLLGTVAWLLWIVSEQAGIAGLMLFALLAIVAAALSIATGKIAPPYKPFSFEVGALAASLAIVVTLWFTFVSPQYEGTITQKQAQRAQQQMTEDGWYRYTPQLVEAFAKEGRTLFIDVTADWCITCKANEAAVLSSQEFRNTMDSLGVALVKADWTRESPEVNALLRSMGKSGVPAYAIYPHGNPSQQKILPELLTTGSILQLLP